MSTWRNVASISAIAAVSLYMHWAFRRVPSKKKEGVRWISLLELNAHPNWVSLCGVVFCVDDEGLVGADGVYGPIGGHDATSAFSGRLYNGETRSAYGSIALTLSLDSDIEGPFTDTERSLLQSWLAVFVSKFPIVGQLSELFRHPQWEQLRSDVLHTPLGHAATPPTCPLGFGTRARAMATAPDSSRTCSRWIDFSGTRYDVSSSSAFAHDSPFAVYVGHDVTYALAIGSLDPDDFDIALNDDNPLTFAQQKALAQYRHTFETTLPIVSSHQ